MLRRQILRVFVAGPVLVRSLVRSLVQRADARDPGQQVARLRLQHDVVQPRVDRLGQRADGCALVAPVVAEQRRHRDRLAHHQQHGGSKQRLPFVIEPDGHHA